MLWCALFFLVLSLFSVHGYYDENETTESAHMTCLPTSVVQGACHICVCNDDGGYQCRAKNCDIELLNSTISEKSVYSDGNECEPHIMYRDGILWCTCSHLGFWKSKNCRSNFKVMKSTTLRQSQTVPEVICESNHYYAVDCNICYCRNGTLESCTSRNCDKGHKADECEYGQLLRLENELCACSETGYYVDKLCVHLTDEKITRLGKSELASLTFESKYTADMCKPNTVIRIDCNKCRCSSNGNLMCTDKLCSTSRSQPQVSKQVSALRFHKRYPKMKFLKLKSANDSCIPGKYYKYSCNTCFCTPQGTPSCTTMLCFDEFKPQKAPSDKEKTHERTNEDVKPIKLGEKCIAGNVYKIECNICKCTDGERLVCSKTVCLGEEENAKQKAFEYKKLKQKKELHSSNLYPHIMGLKEKSLRNGKNIPKKCEPGVVYKRGCQRCFCTDRKIAVCTNRPCDKIKNPVETPEDIGPKISQKQIEMLPSLPHESVECKPGRTYRVDCNACRCLANKNLVCQKKLCPSIEDINRIAASKHTGKTCTDNSEPTECIKCVCKNGKTDCGPVNGCIPIEFRRWIHGPSVRSFNDLIIDADGKGCSPGMIYKQNCNRCYCQDDGTLRCTRKGCLTFQQVERLKKQRDRLLKKEGLL